MLSCRHVVDEMFVSDLCVLSQIMESHKDKNPYTAMTLFCETLTNIIEYHAPLKTKCIHHKNVAYKKSE